MKTSTIVPLDVLAFEKSSYSGSKPVMVLDNASWTLGNEWVVDPRNPTGARTEVYNFRKAQAGERAGHGTYRNSYRSTGVPVLMIEQDFSRWMDNLTPDRQIATPAQDILRAAAKQLGAESAEDLAGHKPKGSGPSGTEVVAEMSDGTKISVRVSLTTVRPQTLVGAWSAFLAGKNQEQAARIKFEAEKEAEANRLKVVSAEVKLRMDELFGEESRPSWHTGQRNDVHQVSSGKFEVSEETLMALLKLALKGSRS